MNEQNMSSGDADGAGGKKVRKMYDYKGLVEEGLEYAEDAIEKDSEAVTVRDWEAAGALYAAACRFLLGAISLNRQQAAYDGFENDLDHMLRRCEQIRAYLDDELFVKGGGDKAVLSVSDPALRSKMLGLVVVDDSQVTLDDVVGLEGAKQALEEAVTLPLELPHLFVGARRPWRGILMYGPPGTGKSFLAKAVAASASNSTFISATASGLMSKYVGESAQITRELFVFARERKPVIIFLDECDSLMASRGSEGSEESGQVKTEFLTQMQGVGSNNDGLLVLGATNLPWSLDSAFLRRFEKRVYIPLPDAAALADLIKKKLGSTPCTLTSDDFDRLAILAEGFSGADVEIAVNQAVMVPVRLVEEADYFKEVQLRVDGESGVVTVYDYLGIATGDTFDSRGTERVWANKKYWTPCEFDDHGATKKTWKSIEDKTAIMEPLVTSAMVEAAINQTHPTVSHEEVVRLTAWTQEFGGTR